jgi:hypothetical protein
MIVTDHFAFVVVFLFDLICFCPLFFPIPISFFFSFFSFFDFYCILFRRFSFSANFAPRCSKSTDLLIFFFFFFVSLLKRIQREEKKVLQLRRKKMKEFSFFFSCSSHLIVFLLFWVAPMNWKKPLTKNFCFFFPLLRTQNSFCVWFGKIDYFY